MKTDHLSTIDSAAIGIDLGGTKTEAILLDPTGTVLWRQRRPIPRVEGYDAVLTVVAEMILETASQLPLHNQCFLYSRLT